MTCSRCSGPTDDPLGGMCQGCFDEMLRRYGYMRGDRVHTKRYQFGDKPCSCRWCRRPPGVVLTFRDGCGTTWSDAERQITTRHDA